MKVRTCLSHSMGEMCVSRTHGKMHARPWEVWGGQPLGTAVTGTDLRAGAVHDAGVGSELHLGGGDN